MVGRCTGQGRRCTGQGRRCTGHGREAIYPPWYQGSYIPYVHPSTIPPWVYSTLYHPGYTPPCTSLSAVASTRQCAEREGPGLKEGERPGQEPRFWLKVLKVLKPVCLRAQSYSLSSRINVKRLDRRRVNTHVNPLCKAFRAEVFLTF